MKTKILLLLCIVLFPKPIFADKFQNVLPKNQDRPLVSSYYDYKLNGEVWSLKHRTCASRTLKRYSMARVTNLSNGKSVECFVNDVIEYPNRDIDLSSYAFNLIGNLKQGLLKVRIEQL